MNKFTTILVILFNFLSFTSSMIQQDWKGALSALALVVSWVLIYIQDSKIKEYERESL